MCWRGGEKSRIGHRVVMDWLGIPSYDDLVDIMHANERLMPGHQPMRVSAETRALLRRIFRTAAAPQPNAKAPPATGAL